MPNNSAQQIAERRVVNANAVLDQTADLRGYPFRMLAVVSAGFERVTKAVAAAEVLESYGWELVTMYDGDSGVIATMRRRDPRTG